MNFKEVFELIPEDPILNKTLGEIEKKQLLDKKFEKPFEQDGEPFTLGVSVSGGAVLKLYNDPSDDDGETEELAQKLGFDDQLDTYSFLSYNLGGKVTAKAGFEDQYFNLGVEAEKEVFFGYYTRHQQDKTLLNALTHDILSPRFFYSGATALTGLADKEAVTLTSSGRFSVKASAAVSDVYTAVLSKVSGLLNLTEALKVEVGAKAELSFESEINDDFEVIIQRVSDKMRVSIHKARKSTYKGSASLSVAVSFDEDSQQVLKDMFKTLLDGTEEKLSDQLDEVLALPGDHLTEEQEQVLSYAASLFNLDPEEEIGKLKEQIKAKREQVEKEVNKVIAAELKAGLTFSYSRVKSSETLFEANYTDQAFGKYISAIRGLNVQQLIDNKDDAGVELTSFERLTKVDMKRSLKLGISVLGLELSQGAAKNYTLDTHEVLKSGKILERVTEFEVGKTFDKTTRNAGRSSSILVGAGMTDYVPQGTIKNSDLQYDFSLVWKKIDNKRTKKYELRSILDIAHCWGILSADDFEDKYDELQGALVKTNRNIVYEMHLKVKRGVFESFIDEIADLNTGQMASIIAASVPYADVRGRTTLKERKANYTGFWMQYLQGNKSGVGQQLRSLFASTLPELALYEADADGSSDYDQFTIEQLLRNNEIENQLENLKKSFKRLHEHFTDSYQNGILTSKFKDPVRSINISMDFTMRVLGRAMHELAIINGQEDGLDRGLAIDPGKGANKILIGG